MYSSCARKLQADPTAKADPGPVNALFSGILLTSDMPSRYTDEMRRQYNALRELTDHAENCTVDADDGLTVHYTLHGQQQAIKVF